MPNNDIERRCEGDSHNNNGAKDWVSQTIHDTLLRAFAKKVEEDNLSEEESAKIMAKVLESGIIEETYSDLLEDLSESITETLESSMYEHVLNARAHTAEFLARQEQKWGKAFIASEALYLCVLEATDNYNAFVVSKHGGEETYKYLVLKNIHGRALQIYKEILCLNQNGFADGAFARWRSLYELSVVACFINKYGESIAKAYVDSIDTEKTNEWARSAPCFKHKKPHDRITLQNLIDNSDINESWRSEYKFSNLFVHSSADATFHRLGACGRNETIPVGHTDWGMTLSATHAADSLVLITVELFSLFPHGDSIAAAKAFIAWTDRIEAFYQNVEDECFPNIGITDSNNPQTEHGG